MNRPQSADNWLGVLKRILISQRFWLPNILDSLKNSGQSQSVSQSATDARLHKNWRRSVNSSSQLITIDCPDFHLRQSQKCLLGGKNYLWRISCSKITLRGTLPLTQCMYARTTRVPFWPTSVPQKVGFSSKYDLALLCDIYHIPLTS